MLPRFPTASSLTFSPERQPQTQPTSPILTFSKDSRIVPESPDQSRLTLDTSLSRPNTSSDAESVFSDAPFTADSMIAPDGFSAANPWASQVRESAKMRPTRRMRRFGAGSVGPKPLILPTTSYCEYVPASAPPLQRSETTPPFFFPSVHALREQDESPSSLASRRRASTMADEVLRTRLSVSPLSDPQDFVKECEDTLLTVACPPSGESHLTARDLSSFGFAPGRNLMDELTAVRSNDSIERREQSGSEVSKAQKRRSAVNRACPPDELGEGSIPDDASVWRSTTLATEDSSAQSSPSIQTIHARRHSRTNSQAVAHTVSPWERLHILLSDLWRSPLALARHLVQTAQSRMRIPGPLRNVQWWLVGVLLGPMARQRMLAPSVCCEDSADRPLLEAHPENSAESLAYGTFYRTPPCSPGRSAVVSGKGKKRVVKNRRCTHQRAKHSPWVWMQFSITLAFAVGIAFKDGPATLLKATVCACKKERLGEESKDKRQTAALLS